MPIRQWLTRGSTLLDDTLFYIVGFLSRRHWGIGLPQVNQYLEPQQWPKKPTRGMWCRSLLCAWQRPAAIMVTGTECKIKWESGSFRCILRGTNQESQLPVCVECPSIGILGTEVYRIWMTCQVIHGPNDSCNRFACARVYRSLASKDRCSVTCQPLIDRNELCSWAVTHHEDNQTGHVQTTPHYVGGQLEECWGFQPFHGWVCVTH